MALTLAACRPLAARRAQVARRAPVAARRPRLLSAGSRVASRPLRCTAPEREPEPAKAPQPEPQQQQQQQQQQGAPPPPPPRLVVKPPPPPPPPTATRTPADDKLPRPKAPLHPFLGFFLSFFSVRRVRALAAPRLAAATRAASCAYVASRRGCAQLGRHLLNLVAFSMLAQLIGAGMHKAGSASEPVVRQVTVGYSDFLRAAKGGRVSYVQLDGKHMTWLQREATVALPSAKETLRAGKALSATASVPETPQTRYITTRPDDAVLPYDTLLSSGAGFHAVSRAGQWSLMNVFNVVVRATTARPQP